jgi:hypothetical protein
LIQTDTTYALEIVLSEERATAFVNGEPLASLPRGLAAGPQATFGLLARYAPVEFTNIEWRSQMTEEP